MNFTSFEIGRDRFSVTNDLSVTNHDLPLSEDDLSFSEDELPDSNHKLALFSDHEIALDPSTLELDALFDNIGSATGLVASKGFSFLSQKIQNGYQALVPQSVKKAVEFTGNLAKNSAKAGLYGAMCFGELIDFTDKGGTKNPQKSIDESFNRLYEHDPAFAKCMEILADQVGQYYLRYADYYKKKVIDPLLQKKGLSSETVTMVEGVFFKNVTEELIAQTLKANVLHIAANLAEESFDPNYSFADKGNPFGRLLSVISGCVNAYEIRLQDVLKLPEAAREEAYRKIFDELSTGLLAKLLPNGASDIQLFHSKLPCIKVVKEFFWKAINKGLPRFLYRFYHETSPVGGNWKEQFDVNACGLKADQLIKLPTILFNHLIKIDGAKRLDGQTEAVKKLLLESGLVEDEADNCSQLFIKYAKDFLVSEDQNLHKLGSFLERYFMERVLFNMSQYLPDHVNDVPLPLYIIQQWIEGNVFKKIRSFLDGSQLTSEENEKATLEMLAPFGLDRRESFPLPPFYKDKKWSKIEKFFKKLPEKILKKIPKWIELEKKGKNQEKLSDLLADSSLTNAVSFMSGSLTDKIFQSLQMQFSLSKKMAALCPSMSADQQKDLDQQWKTLFDENDSLKILKGFGRQCLEAFALQVCNDLYEKYQEAGQIAKGQDFFENSKEVGSKVVPSSFAAWLMIEITDACRFLAIDGVSENELKSLQRAIQLKNILRHSKDPVQAKKDQAEYEQLWLIIKPKFDHITQHLLGVMGYKNESLLPLPKALKPVMWKVLNGRLPHIFFNQFGDLMLPLLEKETLEKQVDALPEGALIRKSCKFLARDIVKHLPEWLEKTVDTLPGKVIADHAKFGFSKKVESYFVDTLKEMLKGEDPAYKNLWNYVESYLEGLFFKVAVRISQMDKKDFQTLRTLAEGVKDELLALHKQKGNEALDGAALDGLKQKEAEKILIQFTDQLFAWLGMETSQDLFGIPKPLQDLAFKGIKAKIAKGLLGFYQLDDKIRHHAVKASPVEEHLPTSAIAKAVLALTRFALDKATDDLTAGAGGKPDVISQIYHPLNLWLDKQEAKDFSIFHLFKDVIHKEVLNPWIINLFQLLDDQSVQPYKQGLADWINPILTDQIISHLAPLLEKEKKKQADFDQAFLLALIPVFKRHIKHIRQTLLTGKELNFENFARVADDELHSGVPLKPGSKKKEDLKGEKAFYKKQAGLIFNLIFPNGKDDFIKILPDLQISDEQIARLRNAVEDLLAEHVPKGIKKLFNKELLVTAFSAFFETFIESLDKPIQINPKKKPKNVDKVQRQMDEQIGSFVLETARLLDLPVKFLERLPGWAKKGVDNIEKNTAASIGAAIRAQFDGKLLSKTIERILPKLAEKKHVKVPKVNLTAEEKIEAQKQAEQHLKDLKRKVAQKSVSFAFRYIRAYFEHVTNISQDPTFQFFHKGIIMVCSFVFVKILGTILHVLKIDQFIANRLYNILERNQEKILTIFAQPDIHKDVLYHGIEAFEGVLMGKAAK